MAVDWESVLAGLVPVVVGIAIGFLLTPLANRWSNRSKRKMLAAVLSPEVETIRAMAAVHPRDARTIPFCRKP